MIKHFYIYGASGFALQIWEAVKLNRGLLYSQMEGFIDATIAEDAELLGYPVYCKEEVLFKYPKQETACFVGFGAQKERIQVLNKLKSSGIELPTILHPSSCISEFAEINAGCFIASNVCIDPKTVIGFGSIINNGSIVSHNTVIEDYVQVCPSVSIAGRCRLEYGSFIGIGACILPDIQIGRLALVGAGSTVTRNVPRNEIVYGTPASRKA